MTFHHPHGMLNDPQASCNDRQLVKPSGLIQAALLAAVACDPGDVRFSATLAPDFAPAGHSVSVLGVYKDGQMSADGWVTLAPHLAAILGSGPCEPGYNTLTSSNTPLADAIDEYTRDNGPTDDLLAYIAPAATGDLILVLTFAGKLPQKPTADAGAAPSSSTPGSPGRGGRGRGGGRMGGAQRTAPPKDTNLVDISALYFSVALGRSVAQVELQYTGASLDEAMTKFAAKVAQTIPQEHCAAWNWAMAIDPDRIRQGGIER
jgi:hypothetical protein